MKNTQSVGVGYARWVAAAALTLCAAPGVNAQPADAAPPVGGPGSLDGIWINSGFSDARNPAGFGAPPPGTPAPKSDAPPPLRTADHRPVPMLPDVAKLVAGRRSTPWLDDSTQRCATPGMPFSVSTPAQSPMQIVETPKQKQITILYEQYTTFRIINMDRPHPAHPKPSDMGDSVGHWEGGALVVDTIAISNKTSIMGVIPHSDQLHVVERIRRTGPTTAESVVTIDDPKTFSRPWIMAAQGTTKFKQVPGMRIAEFVCENNRFNER